MKSEPCYFSTPNTNGTSNDALGSYLHSCMTTKKPYVVIRSGLEFSHIEYITGHLVILDYRDVLLREIKNMNLDLDNQVRESFSSGNLLGGKTISYIKNIPNDLAPVVAKKMCQVFAESLRLRG